MHTRTTKPHPLLTRLMCVPPAFDRSPHPRDGRRPERDPTKIAPSVAIARGVGRPPRLPAPPLALVQRAPPDPSSATFQTRPEPRLPRIVPTAHLPRIPPSARPPPRRRRRERLAEHSEHLERQHADAFGPASSDDIVDPEPFEDTVDTPIEPIEPSPRVRSKGPRRGSKTPASAPAPTTPEGQRLVDLVRAEAGRDASPSQRRVDALLRAEDESRPVVPVRGPNATAATRTATNANADRRDVGGTAGFKKPTAKPTRSNAAASSSPSAPPESSSRSGFLNFGSFWRRKPEDRSPELTKKPSLTLTSAEKARLFSRLHADPSKSVADPDPEETFRPKISTQSRRMGARVHARENRGMRRVDFLLHKGTEDIRDKNERWRAYDDAPPDSAAARTIDPKEYFIDEGSGRVGRPGDKVARALRAARDEAEAAAHTFKPKLNPATRALAESRGGSVSGSAGRIGFYERGLEWIERRKRGVEAAARAREDEEERECTFRPRLVSAVPAFMRKIAAKMRRERLGPGADASAAEGAMASAANRSSGWLAPAPHYAQSPLWDEDADDRSDIGGGDDAVVVGDVRLPSAPADHPATRRASRHVPIKSATSHYRFRDEGVAAADRLEDARLAQRALAELSPGRANANADADGTGSRGGTGNRVSDTKRASDGDYFERLHLERAQRARLKEREKRDALRRHDGSGWRNRVTEPVGPKLGVRPAGEIKSLRRPYTAAPPASLSNSLSNLRVGGGAATRGYQGYYAAVAGGARRAVGPPGWSDAPGTLTEDEYYESAEDGEGIERRLGDQFDDYDDEDAR